MPQPFPTLLDDLFALRDQIEIENHKAVGLMAQRIDSGQSAEWMIGFLDRGQRLLEQVNEVLYKKRK